MALQSSGAISLNEIHVEAGGTTGSQASINDTDIRGLISKTSGAQMSFNEWYGASGLIANFAYTNTYSSSQYVTGSAADPLGANTPTGNSFTYQGVTCHFSSIVNSTALNGINISIVTSGTAVTFNTSDTSWSTIKVWVGQSNNSGSPDATLYRTNANSVTAYDNGTTSARITFVYPSWGTYSTATHFGQSTSGTNYLEFE